MTQIVKVSCFPSDGTPQVLDGNPEAGDIVRITTAGGSVVYERFTPQPQSPSARPVILSKTAFQDYAVAQLGGGTTGMARFTAIMDATRDSQSGAVRFAFARYEAAQTFEKTNTATLTGVMAADSTGGHITTEERTAILDNWPEV